MNKRAARFLAFTLPLSILINCLPSLLCEVPAASAASKSKNKSTKSKSSKSSKKSTSGPSATGLDERALALVNQGKWTELIDYLVPIVSVETSATSNQGWLAFAYLFQNKCAELAELSKKAATMTADAQATKAAKIISLYDQICQKKLDDAMAAGIALDSDGKDVLLNMALAAVAAKQNKPSEALVYINKVVETAPDFAWGYRTAGFIQDRTLNKAQAAEEYYAKALAIEPDFQEVRDLMVDSRLKRNDFDGAVDLAMLSINNAPRDPSNFYRLSQIYTQQWRLREAEAQLDKAIKLDPSNPRYHRAKAANMRYHDLAGAIAAQEKAVEYSTDKTFELIELAALNEMAGNETKAADILNEAMAKSPKNQTAHQKLVSLLTKQKRYADLEKEYRRAIALDAKSAASHLGLANALLKQEKIDAAIEELKEAANLNNNDPRPHRQLGAIYLDRKDFGNASKSYTRALNINPGSVEDLVALGYTYAQNDDFMQAETAFVTALALQQLTQASGNRYEVMRSLAVLLLTEGRYSEAVTNLDAIVASEKDKQQPNLLQDSFLLAQAKAMRDRSSAAVKDLQTAFEAMPTSEKDQSRPVLVETLLRLNKLDLAKEQVSTLTDAQKKELPWLILQSRLARAKGDLQAAQDLSNQALASKDETAEYKAEAHIEQAQLALLNKNYTAAETSARKALDVYQKSFAAYEVLGKIFLKKGDHEHAIEAGKHALEINPYYTPAYLLVGDAYAAANKLDEAANNYKRAVELYPAWLDAHRALRDIYKKLAQADEAKREDEIITQIEKRS